MSSVTVDYRIPYTDLTELIKPGKDQRDYYYFVALGHYKLEVGGCHLMCSIHALFIRLCAYSVYI